MIPSADKPLKSIKQNASEIGDLEFPEIPVSSEELLWSVIEGRGDLSNIGQKRSSEYWSQVEERMGSNVDDFTLILEFEDSFPAEDDDSQVDRPKSTHLSDCENEILPPPPLPLSRPPPLVERDTSPSDTAELQNSEITDTKMENIGKHSKSRSLETDSAYRENSFTDLESTSLNWARPNDNSMGDEVVQLKQQLEDLEMQLTSSQSDCLAVIQSKESLAKDLEEIQKIVEEKEKDYMLLQEELDKIRNDRNSHIPLIAKHTQTSEDFLNFLKASSTQTSDESDFVKMERLLEVKEKELGAKTNEVDHLSREMREWQKKVAFEAEENQKVVEQLEAIQKQLEEVRQKENATRLAVDDGIQKAKKLHEENELLRKTVSDLQNEMEEKKSIVQERDSLKNRVDDLDQSLKMKDDSESELTREIVSLKYRINDLQTSLDELHSKEMDFETLQRKYESLGTLTRRLQTAVSPLKARLARLAQKCRTKDELMQRLLTELHHNDSAAPLCAEAERELTGINSEEYKRPLSPLTISHLDQLDHEILKLDLISGDHYELKRDTPSIFDVFHDSAENPERSKTVLTKTFSDSCDQLPDHLTNVPTDRALRSVVRDFAESDRIKDQGGKKVGRKEIVLDYHPSSFAQISEASFDGRSPLLRELDRGASLNEEDPHQEVVTRDIDSAQAVGIPMPPSNLRVEKVVGTGIVLLSWTLPVMSDVDQSPLVAGYKIYVNGKESLSLGDPRLTKAVLKSLNFNRLPLRFTIRCVSKSGELSSPADAYLDQVLLKKFKSTDNVEVVTSDELGVSSVTSSPTRPDVNTRRKMFLAVYDYRPSGQPKGVRGRHRDELGFQAGDIIVTYGPMQPDGYYVGKVRGRRGLVPGTFLEELAPFTTQDVMNLSASVRSSATLVSSNGIRVVGRRSRSLGAGLNAAEPKPVRT